MTQLPQTGSEAQSPAVDVEPAVLERVADAIFREYADEGRPAPPGESIWTRYARAAITAMPAPAPALDVPLGAGAVVRTKSDRSTTPAGSTGLVIGQASNGPNRYSVMFPGDSVPLSLPAKDLDVVRGLDLQSWWKPQPANGLPRDWVANEVGPDTPYVDEPTEMVPPGVYLLGGFTGDLEDGPQLMLRVEHALDDDTDDERWTPLSLAQAVADRLNGGVR